ncbi:MAG: T9SS type A sorting domain-containing protein [Bacteroidota bacterium]
MITAFAHANDGSGTYGMIDILIELIKYHDFRVIVSRNYIEVIFTEDHTGYKLSLLDLNGKLLQEKQISGYNCILNTHLASSGIYLLVLSDEIILNVRKVLIPEF